MSNITKIHILNSSTDYNDWRYSMEAVLRSKQLWHLIEYAPPVQQRAPAPKISLLQSASMVKPTKDNIIDKKKDEVDTSKDDDIPSSAKGKEIPIDISKIEGSKRRIPVLFGCGRTGRSYCSSFKAKQRPGISIHSAIIMLQ